MNPNTTTRWLARALFYLFAAGVLVWMASLTIQEVQSIFPDNPAMPYVAVALFDGGALAWAAAYLHGAKGTNQRAAAFWMAWADLAGGLLMATGRIFTAGQSLADIPAGIGDAVIYGLIGASALNVLAVYYYHLNEPATKEAIQAQDLEDTLNEEALAQARVSIEREAQNLGRLLAARTTSRLKYRLRLPMTEQEVQEWQGENEIVDGQPEEVTEDSPFGPAPQPGWSASEPTTSTITGSNSGEESGSE